ncbi:LytTr DNA-binding domain protein [compost metagenome]
MYLKSGGKFHKLNIDDILYIESLKDYVVAHCMSNKITAKYKISDLETELQGKGFLRIHRSYLINLKKVTAFTAHDIEIGSKEIPIGASYKEYVYKVLKNPVS